MNVKKGGLGRGLGALIPTSATVGEPLRDEPATQGVVVPGAEFREIPLDAVRPNPKQPRQVFDEEALAELVTSIREVGLLQPIVVRALDDGQYELVMGERRWRASRLAGLDAIPAIVRDTGDDAMLRDALLENLHRQQLNPLEEAAAYAQLLEEFGATHEELASRIGRSRPQVSNTLRLLNLPPAVQRRVAAGVISAGHARALLSLDDAEEQERLAGRIVAEGLSVRAIEEIVAIGDVTAVPARSARAKAPVAPGLVALAERLSDRFETRVKVEVGRQRGKVVVEFATLDDLERILQVMAPDALPSLAPPSEPTSSDANGRHELDPVAERDHAEQHSGESSEPEHGLPEHVQPGDAAEFREGEHQPGTSWG